MHRCSETKPCLIIRIAENEQKVKKKIKRQYDGIHHLFIVSIKLGSIIK